MAKVVKSIGLTKTEKETWNMFMDREMSWFELLEEISDKATKENPVGFILQFPVADGHALYVVTEIEPLTLTHLAIMDGYGIPEAHVRGLLIEDVHNQIESRDFWKGVMNE